MPDNNLPTGMAPNPIDFTKLIPGSNQGGAGSGGIPPNIQQLIGPQSGYSSILNLLSQPNQSLTATAMPALAQILGQQGQLIAPQVAALKDTTASNVAAAQSDAMRRGLTGSDIEAAGMLGARTQGQAQEAQMRSQIAINTSNQLAKMLFQALGVDINANQQQFLMLAQAIGQELSSERGMAMFQQQLQDAQHQLSLSQRPWERYGVPIINAAGGVASKIAGGGGSKSSIPQGNYAGPSGRDSNEDQFSTDV